MPSPDNSGESVFGAKVDIPTSQIWKTLNDKIKNPQNYIGPLIQSVKCEDKGDHIYREMTLTTGEVLKEDVFAFEDLLTVEYHSTVQDIVVVNQWNPERRCLEYRLESKMGNHQGWWEGADTRDVALNSIQKQYDLAKSL
eukprot:TRINITY_DN7288_c0_g1_i1.p1 TRINITY_DN7288_c0_g1~~TRINITY_DN7288_c0_g1_i1.p1  ORF type:complete len:140 (+),score=39.62 TRINITY_DN7288_c0_g1_i1:572-991(+)